MFEISAWQNGRFQTAPGLKIEEIPAAGHLEFTGSHTLATPFSVFSSVRLVCANQPREACFKGSLGRSVLLLCLAKDIGLP